MATLAVVLGAVFVAYGALLFASRAQDEDGVSGDIGLAMIGAGSLLFLLAAGAAVALRRLRP